MRLSDRMQSYVNFANFCTNYGFQPLPVMELIVLAKKRKAIAEKSANAKGDQVANDRADDKARQAVESHAATMGLVVEWNGLWPTVHKVGDRHELHLPIPPN